MHYGPETLGVYPGSRSIYPEFKSALKIAVLILAHTIDDVMNRILNGSPRDHADLAFDAVQSHHRSREKTCFANFRHPIINGSKAGFTNEAWILVFLRIVARIDHMAVMGFVEGISTKFILRVRAGPCCLPSTKGRFRRLM